MMSARRTFVDQRSEDLHFRRITATPEQRLSLEFPGPSHLHPGPLEMHRVLRDTMDNRLPRTHYKTYYCYCPSCRELDTNTPNVTCYWRHPGEPPMTATERDIWVGCIAWATNQMPMEPGQTVEMFTSEIQDLPACWLYYHPVNPQASSSAPVFSPFQDPQPDTQDENEAPDSD